MLTQAIRHDLDTVLCAIVAYTPYACTLLVLHLPAVQLSEHLIHPAASLEVAYKFFAAQKIAFYKQQDACMHTRCLSNSECFKTTVLGPRVVTNKRPVYWALVKPDMRKYRQWLLVWSFSFVLKMRCCDTISKFKNEIQGEA